METKMRLGFNFPSYENSRETPVIGVYLPMYRFIKIERVILPKKILIRFDEETTMSIDRRLIGIPVLNSGYNPLTQAQEKFCVPVEIDSNLSILELNKLDLPWRTFINVNLTGENPSVLLSNLSNCSV